MVALPFLQSLSSQLWHMALSHLIQEYLYFHLGDAGTQKGEHNLLLHKFEQRNSKTAICVTTFNVPHHVYIILFILWIVVRAFQGLIYSLEVTQFLSKVSSWM